MLLKYDALDTEWGISLRATDPKRMSSEKKEDKCCWKRENDEDHICHPIKGSAAAEQEEEISICIGPYMHALDISF